MFCCSCGYVCVHIKFSLKKDHPNFHAHDPFLSYSMEEGDGEQENVAVVTDPCTFCEK